MNLEFNYAKNMLREGSLGRKKKSVYGKENKSRQEKLPNSVFTHGDHPALSSSTSKNNIIVNQSE